MLLNDEELAHLIENLRNVVPVTDRIYIGPPGTDELFEITGEARDLILQGLVELADKRRLGEGNQ